MLCVAEAAWGGRARKLNRCCFLTTKIVARRLGNREKQDRKQGLRLGHVKGKVPSSFFHTTSQPLALVVPLLPPAPPISNQPPIPPLPPPSLPFAHPISRIRTHSRPPPTKATETEENHVHDWSAVRPCVCEAVRIRTQSPCKVYIQNEVDVSEAFLLYLCDPISQVKVPARRASCEDLATRVILWPAQRSIYTYSNTRTNTLTDRDGYKYMIFICKAV